MMAPLLSWFRLDLRRRWRSLLVLAVLVALASGVVMTAAAGANRAASAVDRLHAQTLPATVLVAPLTPGFDWAAVRALPEVQALRGRWPASAELDDVSTCRCRGDVER
jgi:hypothetical protein